MLHAVANDDLFNSLQEEDRIIKKEAVLLKEKVGSRDTTPVSPQSRPAWDMASLEHTSLNINPPKKLLHCKLP